MSTATNKVIDEALDLPAEARINLVDKVLASLNVPTRPEIDRLWAEEAERRISEIDNDDVSLIPGEEVMNKIRRKYSQ